jgi:hypothetical protein
MSSSVYSGFWVDWGQSTRLLDLGSTLTDSYDSGRKDQGLYTHTNAIPRTDSFVIPYPIRTILWRLPMDSSMLHLTPSSVDCQCSRWTVSPTANDSAQRDYRSQHVIQFISFGNSVEREG